MNTKEMTTSIGNIRSVNKRNSCTPYSYFQKNRLHAQNVSTIQEYAYFDEVNIIHRDTMEDGYFLVEDSLEDGNKSLFFGIFDGHHGTDVVYLILKNFANEFNVIFKENDNNIQLSFQKTFEKINKMIEQEIEKQDIGSTAFIGIIIEDENKKRVFHYANVGDTLGYIFDEKLQNPQQIGEIHRLTNPEELKRVKELKGEVLYDRIGGILECSRCFGDLFMKKQGLICEPYCNSIEIQEKHTYLVLGTDGFLDYCKQDEIIKIVQNSKNSQEIADGCLQMSIRNKSTDNISIMIIKLN